MVGTGADRGEIDFTIARGVSDVHVIDEVSEILRRESRGEVELDRGTLNTRAAGDFRLSKHDAECLFTGLVLNGAATQTDGGKSFAHYTFAVDTERAVVVLETQYVARRALEKEGVFDGESAKQSVELTGTFPPPIDPELPSEVRPIAADLRQIFFRADSTVRIASPYFDPSPSVIGDIVGLVNRGVSTKILTRETESADYNLRSTLNRLHDEIDATYRDRLRVRDLYRLDDQTGEQAYATHAKMAVADRDVCYLGSANLTDTSLSTNFELGVLLRGEPTKTAIDVFDTVFDFSRPVDLPL